MEKVYRVLGLFVVVVIIFMAGYITAEQNLVEKANQVHSDAETALESIQEKAE